MYYDDSDIKPLHNQKVSTTSVYKSLCLVCVIFSFSIGLTLGVLIPIFYINNSYNSSSNDKITKSFIVDTVNNNSNSNKNFTTVTFVDKKVLLLNDNLLENGIYWGDKIEKNLPDGYRDDKHDLWDDYIKSAIGVKLENGCGRMQNRLVTFQDGFKGCVRYRQNTDQIQGELFSFYLARILGIHNLAPSVIKVVDLQQPLWKNLRNEIASAQWNSNRPIVITQYISNLNPANIPSAFKPVERHLNKYDVYNISSNNRLLIELAQWSDLIIFDYLTANLDRVVNNLYNYQWNTNIMDAPAHNLAKRTDDLLVFLDNESGLLHGYRLLKKYEIYHSILLENLCLFRKSTVQKIKLLNEKKNIGVLLRDMFDKMNDNSVKDILPTLPDKSVKILNERIEKVFNQISKCESMFAE